jgi:hypothetical protein
VTTKTLLAVARLHLADCETPDFQYAYMRTLAYEPFGAASVGEVLYVARQVARRGGGRTSSTTCCPDPIGS